MQWVQVGRRRGQVGFAFAFASRFVVVPGLVVVLEVVIVVVAAATTGPMERRRWHLWLA